MNMLLSDYLTERELMARVIFVAEQALDPPPNVTVPAGTLWGLHAELGRTYADSYAGDEALMLLQCLVNAARYRNQDDMSRAMRWSMLARCVLPFLRTDQAMREAPQLVE